MALPLINDHIIYRVLFNCKRFLITASADLCRGAAPRLRRMQGRLLAGPACSLPHGAKQRALHNKASEIKGFHPENVDT
jgi:hypothetical protein